MKKRQNIHRNINKNIKKNLNNVNIKNTEQIKEYTTYLKGLVHKILMIESFAFIHIFINIIYIYTKLYTDINRIFLSVFTFIIPLPLLEYYSHSKRNIKTVKNFFIYIILLYYMILWINTTIYLLSSPISYNIKVEVFFDFIIIESIFYIPNVIFFFNELRFCYYALFSILTFICRIFYMSLLGYHQASIIAIISRMYSLFFIYNIFNYINLRNNHIDYICKNIIIYIIHFCINYCLSIDNYYLSAYNKINYCK